ncbi:MAG: response regulator, partial [Bacillota bacterium]
MYKVIIADDDAMFRKYLYRLINWKDHGFQLIGEAKNSSEVLELCKHDKPDVALIDINMPGMDGLLLSEELMKKYHDIAIILITGYSEFKYAKKAINIGVEAYIVKPYDERDLLAGLLKVKEKLQKQKNEVEKWNNFKLRGKQILKVLLENRYTISDETIRTYQEQFGIDLINSTFIVTTVEIDRVYQKCSNVDDLIQFKASVSNIIKEIVKVKGKHFIFNGPEDKLVLILIFSTKEELEKFNSDIFERICTDIKNDCGAIVTIGIGTAVAGFNAIRDSYLESVDALRYKFVEGKGKVLLYTKIKSGLIKSNFYSNEINAKLILYLRINDFDKIVNEVNQIFDYFIKERLSIEAIYANIIGLESVCLSYIVEMGKNIEDVLGRDFSHLKIMSNSMSITEANRQIIEMFEKTANYFHGSKLSKSKKITELVRQIIDINYNDPELCLEKISKGIFLNPDYVRKVFKKELNITITDYITGARMREAKKILDHGNIKFSNLCQEVGYSDASYFSKCFKR